MNKYGLANDKKYLINVAAPSEKIRKFESKKLIGKIVTFKLGKLFDETKKNQYACGNCKAFNDYEDLYINEWIKPIGEENTVIKRKIIDCGLRMHKNGGRSDHETYRTYWSYFNEERKHQIFKIRNGGLIGKIMSGGGDKDQADMWFKFIDFEVEVSWYKCKAPEEWESERLKDKIDFDFKKGFYKDANEAIEYFSNQSVDDMFGTRYFPVAVFDNTTDEEIINHVRWLPKVSSIPIFGNDKVVIGTRCKSYEYAELIKYVYENNGKIANGMQWDWS